MPPASVRNNEAKDERSNGGTRVPKKESVSSTSRMAEVRWPTESRGVSQQADGSKQTRFPGPSTSNEQNQDGSPDSASDQPSVIKKGVMFDDLKLIPTDRRIDPPFWVCFNCWRKGHIAKNCNLPPKHSYCYNCGRVNVKVDDCPRCSEAYFRSLPHRQNAAARQGGQAPRVAQTPSSPTETVTPRAPDEFELRGRRTPDSLQTTLVNESLRGKREQQQPRATARASSTVAAETIEMSKEEEKRRQMEKFRQRKDEERRRELEEAEKKKEEECRYEVEQAELAEQRRRDMELRRERLELFTREQRRRVRRNISADDLKEYIKNLRSLQLPQDLRQDALEAFLYE